MEQFLTGKKPEPRTWMRGVYLDCINTFNHWQPSYFMFGPSRGQVVPIAMFLGDEHPQPAGQDSSNERSGSNRPKSLEVCRTPIIVFTSLNRGPIQTAGPRDILQVRRGENAPKDRHGLGKESQPWEYCSRSPHRMELLVQNHQESA